jgi:hypothetical protein
MNEREKMSFAMTPEDEMECRKIKHRNKILEFQRQDAIRSQDIQTELRNQGFCKGYFGKN